MSKDKMVLTKRGEFIRDAFMLIGTIGLLWLFIVFVAVCE